jgi:GT2 family glycosyltransferase
MISIVYSTHKDNEYNKKFKEHLLKSVGLKNVQILEYQNNNEFSLSEIYNRGISESINNIVVCLHNDVKLETDWGKKLVREFTNNPEYGIIGKAGSCYFPESGVYWEKMQQTMVGQVYHQPEGHNKWLNRYSAKLPFLIPVVTIDGLFISFDKTKIKHQFDESYGKFHFYDHGFCVPNFLDGIKIGVTSSFDIIHQSIGQPNEEFFQTKEKFVEKYKEKLPLEIKPENLYVTNINEKPLKNEKVAIVILTKGKLDLLFDCINSFNQHCNTDLYEIFIGDTGSTDVEKREIKKFILEHHDQDIHLIEYDSYNFARVNNDIVKNHIGNTFNYILFCNNDIKVMNNVIFGMLNIFKTEGNVGTVGCRLHFGDGTVQHDGVVGIQKKDDKSVFVTHLGFKSHYGYTPYIKEVFGNTAALMMIRKNIFEKCGYFDEKYISCFEDVQLNLMCLINGFKNIYDGRLVAYHYESQTRNDDGENLKKQGFDYTESLLPFINENMNKLQKHFTVI